MAAALLVGFATHPTLADFTDVAASSGTDNTGAAAGVAWVDYDNDGYLDLYVNGAGALYRNLGNGTFYAPISLSGSRQCIWADFDNDGDLDLKVTGAFYRNEGNGTFSADVDSAIGISGPCNEEGAAWIDYNNDGLIDLFIPDGTCDNLMFRNLGDGTFTSLGPNPAGLTPDGNGDFMAVGDYDGDGFVDMLYRISTGNTPLWRNNGNGTFTESSDAAGLSFTAGNSYKSGLAFGDYDNDGDLDLFVGVYAAANVLYRNNGNGTFTDVTATAGVAGASLSARGVAWGDYDNDGDLDLYVGNDGSANNLFENNGDGTFTDVAVAQGVADASATQGVAFADFDNDGDLDIYVSNNNQTNRLYRNDLDDGRSLHVKVSGAGAGFSSLDAIGARVSLFDAGDTLLAVREVNGSRGFGSQDPLKVHFGLDPTQAYTIRVNFPSGLEVARSAVVPQNASILVGAVALSNTVGMDEGVGVNVMESGGATDVNETGPTADTYTLALNTQPAADVTVTADPDAQTDLGAGAGTAINLVFTPADWDTPQVVTVTAVDDALIEGGHTSTITHSAASNDPGYDGIGIESVTANITDDDTAGVTIVESGGSTAINETGPGTDTYTVVLDAQPAENVTVVADPDAQTDLGAGADTAVLLTFTSGNWNVPQTVTVTAVDDGAIEGAHTSTITHSAISVDTDFNGVGVPGVTVDISDNDVAGVTIAESDGSSAVRETGPTSDTYTVVLDAQPTDDVLVMAQPDAQLDLGAGPGVAVDFAFSPTDWSVPRTIVITAVDDTAGEGPHSSTIVHVAASDDPAYDGAVITDVTVSVGDNDLAGVTITESNASSSVSEIGPTSDTYTLVLDAQPAADVVIAAQPDAQLDLGAGPGTALVLTFTPNDWSVPRTLVITPVDDGVVEGPHRATIAHAANSADSSYDGIAIADLTVDITDDNDGDDDDTDALANNAPTYGAAPGGAGADDAAADDDDGATDEPAEDEESESLVAYAGPEYEALVGALVLFDASESYAAPGVEIVRYSWDFDARDGIGEDALGMLVERSFDQAGVHLVTLTLTDEQGRRAHDTVMCTVFDDVYVSDPVSCGPLCGPMGMIGFTLLLVGMGAATRPGRAVLRAAARMLADWVADARRGRTCDVRTLAKRRHPRWSWARQVMVLLEGQPQPVRTPTEDVSESGMRIWYPERLTVGQKLQVGDGIRDAWLQARVVHVAAEPNEQGLYRTGIQFEDEDSSAT